MKKTLVALMVMGLSLSAAALPPVTAESCEGIAMMEGEFYTMLGLLGGELDGLPAAEVLDLEGLGLPDIAKAQLLAGGACVDEDIAAALEANKLEVLGFCNQVFGLVTWAAASVDEVTAAAAAVDTFAANPAYLAALDAVLQGFGMSAQEAGAIIIMLSDPDLCEAYDLDYIPDLLDDLAAELTGIGTQAPANPYFALPYAMSEMFPNAMTAWLSCSSVGQANLVALIETELLDNARDYADALGDVKQIFDALAYTCANVVNELAMAATFAAMSGAMEDGIDAIDAIVVPTPPIIGAAKADNGEPFSGGGDYDGDGVLNSTTWAAIADAGGTVADFVAAASGANPWYPGNPNLPAAGIVGLAALVSAIAGGAAFVIRKK